MKIRKLTLKNFRNIADATLEFKDGVNILYGENGSGKTNILEAVYLFSIGKSLRTNDAAELIRHGEKSAYVEMFFSNDYDAPNTPPKKMTSAFYENKKVLTYEGAYFEKLSKFISIFRSVYFRPDDMALVKGSPSERRKFADIALCKIRSSYIDVLMKYNHAGKQRNAYIRDMKSRLSPEERENLADVIAETLSESASVLTKERYLFTEMLSEKAKEHYKSISSGSEDLGICYLSCAKEKYDDTAYTKSKYKKLFYDDLMRDFPSIPSKYGPHRDEIFLYFGEKNAVESAIEKDYEDSLVQIDTESAENGSLDENKYSVRSFGSQGQQRSAVLALKLAEGSILKEKTGEKPIYLFDDVLSELDENRKQKLLSMFSDGQIIITCCDKSDFSGVDANIIRVSGGTYTNEC